MTTRINPQEIYLLERYISVEYFGELRNAWEEMVKHVEACLELFMQNISPNYRSRSLPEQADVVWGQRVLPNFRGTMEGLNTGFILLTHNDLKGLGYAWGPKSDFKGQMEYWAGWMSKEDQDIYHSLLMKATTWAGNICATEGAYWNPSELSNYSEEWGPLDPPAQWPSYRVNKSISVLAGQKLNRNGIYVPDVNDSGAQFLSTNYETAPQARVLVGAKNGSDSTTGEKWDEEPIFEQRSCTWYLVERLSDQDSVPQVQFTERPHVHRAAAGEMCPETGFYLTPAHPDSRRLFHKDEVMPTFDTAYGATIWQWDSDQT